MDEVISREDALLFINDSKDRQIEFYLDKWLGCDLWLDGDKVSHDLLHKVRELFKHRVFICETLAESGFKGELIDLDKFIREYINDYIEDFKEWKK